jgi:triphosphoribosyl-dephospho-CoA synthase
MSENAWKITSVAQLSVLLEVSSPKPGNVNRLRRFSDTGYRHFLASASLLARGLFKSADKGAQLVSGSIGPDEVELGPLILECSQDVFSGLNRRNTIIGTILLYIPVVVAAGATIAQTGGFDARILRSWVKKIIDSTTVNDTLNMFNAFHLANPRGNRNREIQTWTGIHDRFDINNPEVMENIRQDNITLQEMFRLSSEVEPISKEWSDYFKLTIDEVYPYLNRVSTCLDDLEEGVVRTFIWLLARQPDGLIIKKAGMRKAQEIQKLAKEIVASETGNKNTTHLLGELDSILREDGNRHNPGTTADFVSVAILLRLLEMTFHIPNR